MDFHLTSSQFPSLRTFPPNSRNRLGRTPHSEPSIAGARIITCVSWSLQWCMQQKHARFFSLLFFLFFFFSCSPRNPRLIPSEIIVRHVHCLAPIHIYSGSPSQFRHLSASLAAYGGGRGGRFISFIRGETVFFNG